MTTRQQAESALVRKKSMQTENDKHLVQARAGSRRTAERAAPGPAGAAGRHGCGGRCQGGGHAFYQTDDNDPEREWDFNIRGTDDGAN